MAQLVKNLPAMQETWVRSLGGEDHLEKGKATHSSILAWRMPWSIVHGVTKSQTLTECFHFHFHIPWASLVAQMIKNLPAMWETWVQSPGLEVLLKKGMATHSSILACRIPWTQEPGRLQLMES